MTTCGDGFEEYTGRGARPRCLVLSGHWFIIPGDWPWSNFHNYAGKIRDASPSIHAGGRLAVSPLEFQLQSQLALPGPDGRIVDNAEGGVAHISVGRAKHRVVKGVLRLQAQFQLHAFMAGR